MPTIACRSYIVNVATLKVQGCCTVVLCRLRRRRRGGRLGNTPDPGKGLPPSALLLAACGGGEGDFLGDTPDPRKGLLASSLLLSSGGFRSCSSPALHAPLC